MKQVLWTGGWDSTFRVLDLLLMKNETVQPHYILDPQRKSASMEMATMDRIRSEVIRRRPDAEARFLKTIVVDRGAIPEDETITAAYRQLLSRIHVGTQYDWLCRYAQHSGVEGLELGTIKGGHFEQIISSDMVVADDGNDRYITINNPPTVPELRMFVGMHFPLMFYSKLDMGELAKQYGFADLMEMTWFCHTPTRSGKPCGICEPCRIARQDGLGRRVPPPTVMGRLKLVKRWLTQK